ncbi:hypothetical protein M5689_020873 [Euphorbia peplus]|nr:hypothetical protein M5689_020873 [Euphorbia peplus]
MIIETLAVGNPKPATDHNPLTSQISDKEITPSQSGSSYTSLKDILPTSPPTSSSSTLHNSSWHEIPIKNHLVKQAALAYLQPACSLPEVGRRGCFGRLKDTFTEECGCLFWLNGVVVKSFRDIFYLGSSSDETGELECDYEYDQCDYEKVD